PSRTPRSGSPISATSSSIGSTYAGAPPCSGPERAPTAADIAAPQSAPVEATTRAVNVEALRPCSAVQIQYVSIALTCRGSASPRQRSRNFSAAVAPPATTSSATGSRWPSATRAERATIAIISAESRARPARSGSAISVSKATTPSRPGLKSFRARAAYRDRPGATSVESCAVAHRVTLIPGDGTGPELTEATRRVLEATGVEFEWDVRYAGADVMDKHGGNPLPPEVLDAIRETGVALKGPITTPIGGGFRSVNVALRKELDLYAQVRPCK